jgi:predicted nucleic acid-binding protein
MILVDSNVLIDISARDPKWFDWSAEQLALAMDREDAAINPIIYAEVSVGYANADSLDAALEGLQQLRLPFVAAFVAGKAFREYRRRGGTRMSTLPDFYIGAHAAVEGMALLTRDRVRYASYFPSVKLIAP